MTRPTFIALAFCSAACSGRLVRALEAEIGALSARCDAFEERASACTGADQATAIHRQLVPLFPSDSGVELRVERGEVVVTVAPDRWLDGPDLHDEGLLALDVVAGVALADDALRVLVIAQTPGDAAAAWRDATVISDTLIGRFAVPPHRVAAGTTWGTRSRLALHLRPSGG